MNVTELLKKSVAFGLGAAAFSAEKVKQFADDMVARGEMSSEEARSFVDEVSEKAEEEKQSIQTWVSEQVSRMLQQAGAAEAKRVALLELRVAALERHLTEVSEDMVIGEPETEEIAPS